MNAINHWCPMAMMSSPADDDGRTPPKDMQTPNNRPKIFLKFVVIVLQIITYFTHPMYKTYDKMPYDNFLYFWFFTIYKKLTKENDWKMDPQTLRACYFKSWWARLFAVFSTFLNICSNAIWDWLEPHCAAELNAMGTDYDPQFSHLNVTCPEKYPFLPIKSPCITPFPGKTCWSSLIWKVY